MNTQIPSAPAAPDLHERLPARIGPFRILEQIGAGAMGRVYRAEQETPHREVALKVLWGATQSSLEARFRREVEVLAELEHPGIARVYAAGIADTDLGAVPYLAMELVQGPGLPEHAQRLPLRRKVELLVELSRAVHYAHTRGVIHRDLKPANLRIGADGRLKVLDFGLALALNRDDLSRVTSAGEVVGTLAYMSWEQLRGDARAADARSDVHAIGVIAYELLAGRLPYPSSATATLVQVLDQRRGGEPEALGRAFPPARGDLATIVTKAMAREPDRRYGSAAELAADFERYLAQRPIEARPPTLGYTVGLLLRRHRALSAALALALFAVLAGLAGSSWFAVSEARARRAEAVRAAELEGVNEFVRRMLTAADPENARGRELTMREVLDAARATLAASSALPPAVRAAVGGTLGDTYLALGAGSEALEVLSAAAADARAAFGIGPEAMRAELRVAAALTQLSRNDQAETLLRELAGRALPAGTRAGELRADVDLALAINHMEQGRYEDALTLLQALHATPGRRDGDPRRFLADSDYWRAQALASLGRMDEAYAAAEDLVATADASYGAEHQTTLAAKNALAYMRRRQGREAEALELYQQVAAVRRRVLRDDHPGRIFVDSEIAEVLSELGRHAEAEALAHALVAQVTRVYGTGTREYLSHLGVLGKVLLAAGKHADALAAFERLAAVQERIQPADHPDRIVYGHRRAKALIALGRARDALSLLDPVFERALALLGPEHPEVQALRVSQGRCLLALGRPAEAVARLETAAAALAGKLGAEHAFAQEARRWLEQARAAAGS